MNNIYETEKLLSEYLLFHYGFAEDFFTGGIKAKGVRDALHFPERSVNGLLDFPPAPDEARALDVGCAVGRASFELARHCGSVTGIDFSSGFIGAARVLAQVGELAFERLEEGARTSPCMARVPQGIVRERVAFETGDAMALREDLGAFDIVLAANLLCRLPDPAKFLARLPGLVKAGGQLAITTPCTWLEEFTPREKWLCDDNSTTLDGLHRYLDGTFDLVKQVDLPMIIREHARKFQWTVALGTLWRRKE